MIQRIKPVQFRMTIPILPSRLKSSLCFCGDSHMKEVRIAKSHQDEEEFNSITNQGGHDSTGCSIRLILLRFIYSTIKCCWVCSSTSGSRSRSVRVLNHGRRRGGTYNGLTRRRNRKKSESTKQSLLLCSCATNIGDPLKSSKSSSLSSVNSNSPPDPVASAGRHMEVSFNMGLGLGLVYLIATCKNEFDKMMELRTQMQELIQDVKNDIISRKDQVTSGPSDTNANLSHPTNHNNPSLHYPLFKMERSMDCDKNSNSNSNDGDPVDQMEEELKVQLERLELNLDTELILSSHSLQQQKTETVLVESSAAVTTHGASLELMENHQEGYDERVDGVSAKELERRLHELLEARQRERITELENALECAKKRLHQKEMEASWWKDTARLISQHVSESKCLSR